MKTQYNAKTNSYSLYDRNSGKQAKNILGTESLEDVARPWFSDYLDSRVDQALRDLNKTGRKQRQALDYLNLELVSA